MFKKLSIAVFLSLFIYSVPGYADVLLASYEPSEADLTILTHASIDPGLTVTWPVLGGTAGVPTATQGSYVLKMQWTGETDNKVEIEHQWSSFTFDLADHERILIDVYINTAPAVPGNIGLWDAVFDWRGGFPIPPSTGEWITVAMDVSGYSDTGLSGLYAFVLADMAGTNGTVYLDNLRITSDRQINFAGHSWSVKYGNHGPGPNYFSDTDDVVWVDSNDHLHMNIKNKYGYWFCSEIINDLSFGYGTYVYTLKNRVDMIDLNAILGLFTWDSFAPANNYTEIDFEFGRWQVPANGNSQYVVQPWDTFGNVHRFDIDYSGPAQTTTHIMTWRPSGIYFKSYYGDFALAPPPENIIHSWLYTGGDIPTPTAENARINYWLISGLPPVINQDHEFILSDFQVLSDISDKPGDINNDDSVDFEDFSALANEFTGSGCDAFNNWCDKADLTGDGNVDMYDVEAFIGYWLD